MKIAFIVSYFPSLSETFVLNQITGLIDRGHEIDIYAETPGNTSTIHPEVESYSLLERTYYSASPSNPLLKVLKALGLFLTHWQQIPVMLRTLNFSKYGQQATSLRLLYGVIPFLPKRSYDIIHCHFGQNGLKAVQLRDLGVLEGKIVTTFHGNDITTYIKKVGDRAYEQLFQMGDIFQPISDRWKQRLIALGCSGEIMVHRMGIDCTKFGFYPRQLRADGKVRIVTIARLVEKKGVEYGIRAVAELAKTKPNLEYTIVGDGSLRKDLEQLTQQLKVNHIVKLVGWKQQQEVIEILHNSDILLAPSVTSKDGDQEGIPVTLMETMAMGLPIISTQHSGIPELIDDGVSGFLVPERDVDALVEKLDYLVENPEVWSNIGMAGRAQVEKHYNINKLNDELVNTYHNLLNCKLSQEIQENLGNYSIKM